MEKAKSESSCIIPACGLPIRTAKYCSRHYAFWLRHDKPDDHAILVEIGKSRAARAENKLDKGPCSELGCPRPARTKGLCIPHYNKKHWLENRDLFGTRTSQASRRWWEGVEEHPCSKCCNIKPIPEFTRQVKTSSTGRRFEAILKICSECYVEKFGVINRECRSCGADISDRLRTATYCLGCAATRKSTRKRASPFSRMRTAWKKEIIDQRGGPHCKKCGFTSDVLGVFEFHHKDPSLKTRELSRTSSFQRYSAEADLCDLLCANCHRIVHHAEVQARRRAQADLTN